MVSEKELRDLQMNAAVRTLDESALVEQAAGWAELIVCQSHRGYGDTIDAATHRASRQLNIPEKVFRALRFPYRRPRHVAAGVYLKLREVGEAIETGLRSEIVLAEAAGLNEKNSAAVRAAVAALGKAPREAGRGRS